MRRIVVAIATSCTTFGSSPTLASIPNLDRGAYAFSAPASLLPVSFELNRGQANEHARFIARAGNETLVLTDHEAVLHVSAGSMSGTLELRPRAANTQPNFTGWNRLPGHVNYFISDDSRRWLTDIPIFAGVRYHAVYADTDLLYHAGRAGIEYDWVLGSGADPARIQMGVYGIGAVGLDKDGNVVAKSGLLRVTQRTPRAYQVIAGKRHRVQARFTLLSRHIIGFQVGRYNRRLPLVIDPVLGYATMLGGSSPEWGTGIAVDSVGDAFVTGATESTDFPTAGSLQTEHGGGYTDAFVAKLNPAGDRLLWATYLGGRGEDIPADIALDAAGNAYVVGATTSRHFPTFHAFQARRRGQSAGFITEIAPGGDRLVYSTYFGGSGNNGITAIAVDGIGSGYVTGHTDAIDFPTVNALQSIRKPEKQESDAFISRFAPGGATLVFSTYFGGNHTDDARDIAIDRRGNAYVTGATNSDALFPLYHPIQSALRGGTAVFVAKLNGQGSKLLYGTYLGGSASEVGTGIAVDSAGSIYVAGGTTSPDFPVLDGFQRGLHSRTAPDAFITKIDKYGKLAYSTFLGGAGYDFVSRVVVNSHGEAYVAGETGSSNFPLRHAILRRISGSTSGFVAQLNASGSALRFSTYLGGTSSDYAADLALDASGSVYVTGSAYTGFPTLNPLPFSGGGGDAFIAKLIAAP